MKLSFYSIALVLPLIHGSVGTSQLSALKSALLDGYDKDVKPDGQVEAKVNVHVNDMKLCPHKQVLTTYGWTMMSWVDPRLTWDAEKFGGLNRIRINAQHVWIPDIALYNAVDPPQSSYVTWEKNTNVIVMSDGLIIFVPPTTYRSHCNVNYEDWPWGTQNCSLTFGSWTYDKSNIDIEPYTDMGSACPDVSMLLNNQLEMMDSNYVKEEKEYECCPDESYPTLKLNFQFQLIEKFIGDALTKSPSASAEI